jgi:hypothetical protein
MNCELILTYDIPAYMFNVYKNQPSRQTGSKNLMGPKTLPTIWGTYMKLVTKYQISAINSCWEKWKSDISSQSSYWYTILWEVFLDQSDSYFLFADLVGFYTHWTYMHIFCHIFLSNYWWQKSDIWSQVGKQEVGIWLVQKYFPQYCVPIWRLWRNIRFLPSKVAEKNATKN